jgi:nucleoside-diphosphate-sugar epimerase
MERRLYEASQTGIRVLIVRAGDFFGPTARNNWFSQGLVKPGKPVAAVSNPTSRGVGHSWSYLPDVARTMIALLSRRESLEPFATFHMAGHWDADGTQMAAAIQRIVMRRTGRAPRIAAFPWWLVSLASPFVTTFREMLEIRYVWRGPVRLDNTRLIGELGREPHTPLDEAVEATLRGLGCVSP